jgi:hypothetical protein
VARHAGADKARNGSGLTALMLLVEQTAQHPVLPLRPGHTGFEVTAPGN